VILPDPIRITELVARVFEQLGIHYYIAGSIASSLHGIPRATYDVDIVADMKLEHVGPFVKSLKSDFYIDSEMIEDAIINSSMFNIVYLETMFKIDIFVSKEDEFSNTAMTRSQRYKLLDESSDEISVASAEDVILHKLYWFRIGDKVAERQWADTIGVLQVMNKDLDLDYLHKGANMLGVKDLLEQALNEAKLIQNTIVDDD